MKLPRAWTKLVARDTGSEGEWFHEMPREQQEQYIKDHPNSKYANDAKNEVTPENTEKQPARSFHKKTSVVDGKRVSSDGTPLPEHVTALKIPPAWTDVTYSDDPKAALQATGRDSKGRPQSIYSKEFADQQAAVKFARIQELNSKFDEIYAQNEKLRKSKDPKVKAAADCSLLIMRTGIRPGSEDDTGAKVKAYGATTLEGKHVIISKEGVSLQFVGKKGVSLNIPVEDPEVVKLLKQRKQASGADGQLFSISERALLEHVHSFDGGGFKSKDFRTLLGTSTAKTLVEAQDVPRTQAEYKKAVLEVAKKVSKKLGNTPVIALQSYIAPMVFASWVAALGDAA